VIDGKHQTISGEGNGPIDAFVSAMRTGLNANLDVVDYTEHAIGKGSEAKAVAYVETINGDGEVLWGVGTDENTVTASLRAVLSAHERHTSVAAH
jgi:2-isopropylmalate synthase